MSDVVIGLGNGGFYKCIIRHIPLTAEVLKLLENQKNYWGFKVEKIDRYLFCDADGNPVNVHLLQAEIDKTIKRIHEDGKEFPRITSHVFRHTFATRAIEAGMQPQVLKTIMGHSSLAMTMDLYSHVLPDTKAEEICSYRYQTFWSKRSFRYVDWR